MGSVMILFLVGTGIFLTVRLALVQARGLFSAVIRLELAWNISDAMNGLIAIPNLIGLIGLSGIVAHETKKYFASRNG